MTPPAGLALSLFATFAVCRPPQEPSPPKPRLVGSWKGHSGSVHSIAVSADGARAVTASEDGTLRIWKVADGVTKTVCKQGERVWAAAFLPGGDRVVAGGFDGRLTLWNADDGARLATFGPEPDGGRAIACLAVSADGKTVLTGGFDGRVRSWDLAARGVATEWSGHSDTVFAVAFGPGPDRIASGSFDGTLRIVDRRTNEPAVVLTEDDPEQRGWKRALVVAPDGRRILAAGAASPREWDPAVRSHIPFSGEAHTESAVSIAVAPDHRTLVTGGFDGHVHVWDIATRRNTARFAAEQGDGVWALAFLPDGRLLSAGNSGTVKLWEIRGAATRPR